MRAARSLRRECGLKLTVFTSNQPRHLALLDALYDDGHQVQAVIEPKSWVPGRTPVLSDYWRRVHDAETDVFGAPTFCTVPTRAVPMGELSLLSPTQLTIEPGRVPIVFGSSYITGWLADELIFRGALNLHGGLAPYYRGAAPNFWALYDKNPHLVGAQVQRLSKGLDAGEILATTRVGAFTHEPPFRAGMLAIARGIDLVRILLRTPEPWIPVDKNDCANEIAYHRGADFTEAAAAEYLARLGSL